MSAAATPAHVAGSADRSGLRVLTLSHLINDLNQGVLPAMIPWLVTHRHLSLAAAATLVLAANLLGSVVQPLFGYLSDKRSTAWVIPVAIVVATAGTAVVGLAPTMPLMLLGAVLSGFGVAAFHPEASRFSNYFAGAKRASGMSLFTFGGYVGIALGPLIATPLIALFGLRGVALLLLPALIVAALLVRELPRFMEVRRAAHKAHRERPGHDDWRAFAIMSVVVALRSTAFLCAVTFTEVFVMRVTHVGMHYASLALTALLSGGAFGTLYGGRLADRFDRRRVVTLSLVLTTMAGALFAFVGAHVEYYPVYPILALAFGLSLGLSAGVLVVVGQEYLPKHIGIASGMTLGLANTIGGIAAPAFGKIGDDRGVVMIFAAIALSTALATIASLLMPAPARHHKPA
jgi:MFS transporter, FSR family, fosmidomycin resistance protein